MNKFFTILFIPEKTDQVKKLLIPTVYLRVSLILGFFGIFFLCFMIYDYVQVMQQLAENRKLVVENRELRERIQGFTNKLHIVEESMERIQTFATKLRIITNQGSDNTEFLKEKATRDFPGTPMDDHSVTPGTTIQKQLQRPRSPEEKGAHFAHFMHGDHSNCNHEEELKFARWVPHSGARFPSVERDRLWRPGLAIGGPEIELGDSIATVASLSAEPRHLGGKIPDLLRPKNMPKTSESMHEAAVATTELTDSARPKRFKRISELLQSQAESELDRQLNDDFTRLNLALEEMQKLAETVEIDVQDLSSTLLDQKDYLNSMPTLKPSRGWYTSGFGMRLSPYTGRPTMHEGLDIANHYGKAIISPAAGMVSFVGVRPGYGKLVTIDHGYGIQTQYGHVSKFYVKEGARVKRGMKIAAIGSTGRSTGPHVHYEVRVNGIPVDPYFYILND